MNTVDITIDGKDYEIQELSLGKFPGLFKRIKKLPAIADSFTELSEKEIVAKLPEIAEEAFPELLDLLHYASGIDKKTLEEKAGIKDAAQLVSAIIEVNDIKQVSKIVAGLTAQFRGRSASTNGSIASSTPSQTPTSGAKKKS